ncbi:MAG: GNAT family N-acetyltransferase, partial [Lachnospiraceae bacterium]|nr:GNAT family N-acetyltransferase [Lachnospiraceae bacterium]
VDSGCRHFGIGRKLIRKALESGRIKKLYAQTDEEGVGFYRGCGFVTDAEVKQYPDGEVARYHCTLQA